MVIGRLVGLIFTAFAPFIKKWLVAPESDSAHATARVTRPVLKIISACGSSCKLFACTMCLHALCLAGVVAAALLAGGGVVGMMVGHRCSGSRLFSSMLCGFSKCRCSALECELLVALSTGRLLVLSLNNGDRTHVSSATSNPQLANLLSTRESAAGFIAVRFIDRQQFSSRHLLIL